MKSPGTHVGTCQCCGRIQVVESDGKLAKHGYRVAGFGYFAGVCAGADELPLQQDRTILDATVESLGRYAVREQMAAERLESGADLPESVYKRDFAYGGIVRDADGKAVEVSWADANEDERRQGLKLAIDQHRNEAGFARSHAEGLVILAAKVHGTALVERSEYEAKPEQPAEAKVDVKTGVIIGAFRTKAAQKNSLEAISRAFERQTEFVRNAHLAIPHDERTEESTDLYFALPHYPHEFRPKHAEAIMKVFPHMGTVVAELNRLVALRATVRALQVQK